MFWSDRITRGTRAGGGKIWSEVHLQVSAGKDTDYICFEWSMEFFWIKWLKCWTD